MINKLTLSSIIKKYYLGEIEQVKWSIKNNQLEINFISPTKILIGKVRNNQFRFGTSILSFRKILDKNFTALGKEYFIE